MKLILIIISFAASARAAVVVEASLDVRPSWTSSAGTFHTENEVAVGARWSETAALGYVQEFRTNLSGTADGLSARAKDGYFKGNFALGGPLVLEPRLILPTDPNERAASLRMTFRPILKAVWSKGSGPGLEVWESPVLPWYGAAGAEVDGALIANRSFENRVEIVPRWDFWEGKVAFKMPIVWQLMKRRSLDPGAANDGRWHSLLWINPEVVVSVANHTGLGLAYYSETFTGEGASLRSGLRQGVFQAVLQQSL